MEGGDCGPSEDVELKKTDTTCDQQMMKEHHRRRYRLSIPERLDAIRTRGGWNPVSQSQQLPSSYNRSITATYYSGSLGQPWNASNLASAIAWNPTRMRNMILAVGPTTPAAVCWGGYSDSENDDDHHDYDDDDDDDDDDEVDDDEHDGGERPRRGMPHILQDYGSSDDESDVDDYDYDTDDGDNDDGVPLSSIRGGGPGAKRLPQSSNNSSQSEEDEPNVPPTRDLRSFESPMQQQEPVLTDESQPVEPVQQRLVPQADEPLLRKQRWSSSIRHSGCINTACWLNDTHCPWRISTASIAADAGVPYASPHAVMSHETSTQIITSSDDRIIKIWDVSHAMGIASPLPGGWDTYSPMAHGWKPSEIGTSEQYTSWKQYYRQYGAEGYNMAGGVHLLASVNSGHRGNVFHVTPIGSAAGKVLTCGADGYLRMTDLHHETSTVVVHPYAIDTDTTWEHLGGGIGGMAYSHLSLTAHTGLLCSERGLHHFDLRVPPREQCRRSLLSVEGDRDGEGRSPVRRSVPCKTCVIWSPNGQHSPLGDTEPNMVFVGGASVFVELLDLRVQGQTKKTVVQRYKPRCLTSRGDVSVSGLDVSKDGKELLVSYESDQIYTFPIFPSVSGSGGPSPNDIDQASVKFVDSPTAFQPELAMYGGHLNRFTFLKNAKYAGPNDDYILTGSDSGKAWIYERKTGAIASLLGADSSTCNGVIPHPTLPFFITYGIDSTAKLWRAALCVDSTADDSVASRAKTYLTAPFDISPVVLQCEVAQAALHPVKDEKACLPDLAATPDEVTNIGRFAAQTCPEISGPGSARVGNAYLRIPAVLRQARYECYSGKNDHRAKPIEQPLEVFTVGVSWNRLRNQAASLGLHVNPWAPWIFEGPQRAQIHKAELVPDNPSDWLLYDPQMTTTPLDIHMRFNVKDFRDICQKRFPDNAAFFYDDKDRSFSQLPWLTEEQQLVDADRYDKFLQELSSSVTLQGRDAFCTRSRILHFETIAMLKESGNDAVKLGLLDTAARRYDKAIQYCVIAYMKFYEGTHGLKHLAERAKAMPTVTIPGHPISAIAAWTPLLRVLITCRLNLSLVLNHAAMTQPIRAADQARFAVRLLSPFTKRKGKIILTYMLDDESTDFVVSEKEPETTYRAAKALEAKAYFRLGSAEFETRHYANAAKSFESSLRSLSQSTRSGNKTDSVVVKRLQEAKRKFSSRKRRTGKKSRTTNDDTAED